MVKNTRKPTAGFILCLIGGLTSIGFWIYLVFLASSSSIHDTRIIFDYMPSLIFGVAVVIAAIYGLKANKNGFYLIISVSIFALIYIKILAIYYTSYIPLFVLMVHLTTFPICFYGIGAILSIIGGVLGVSKS